MENHHAINGWIHYSDWAMASIANGEVNYQAGYIPTGKKNESIKVSPLRFPNGRYVI